MLSHRLAFAGMLFIVSACATATTPEALEARQEAREQERRAEVFADDPRRGEEVKRVCFARQIDSFGETTDRAVVIREGRDYYLLETFADELEQFQIRAPFGGDAQPRERLGEHVVRFAAGDVDADGGVGIELHRGREVLKTFGQPASGRR